MLDLYDSSGELVESVPLDWDGTGGFVSVGLDHVAAALRQRGLVYGGAAWNEQGGAWHAVVHGQGWPGKRF